MRNKTKVILEYENMFLVTHGLKKRKKLKIQKYLELHNKENTVTQNFGNVGEWFAVGNF